MRPASGRLAAQRTAAAIAAGQFGRRQTIDRRADGSLWPHIARPMEERTGSQAIQRPNSIHSYDAKLVRLFLFLARSSSRFGFFLRQLPRLGRPDTSRRPIGERQRHRQSHDQKPDQEQPQTLRVTRTQDSTCVLGSENAQIHTDEPPWDYSYRKITKP